MFFCFRLVMNRLKSRREHGWVLIARKKDEVDGKLRLQVHCFPLHACKIQAASAIRNAKSVHWGYLKKQSVVSVSSCFVIGRTLNSVNLHRSYPSTCRSLFRIRPTAGKEPSSRWCLMSHDLAARSSSGSMKMKPRDWAKDLSTNAVNLEEAQMGRGR